MTYLEEDRIEAIEKAVAGLTRDIDDMTQVLHKVVNEFATIKVHVESMRPPRNWCIHCGRAIDTANGNCGLCGKTNDESPILG